MREYIETKGSGMKLAVVLGFALIVGCNSSPSVIETEVDIDAELALVQNCFQAAVVLLDRGPNGRGDWPQFLGDAAVASNRKHGEVGEFAQLNWSDDGQSLLTSDGQTIQCRVVDNMHDNYGPGGGTAFITKYELTVSDTNHLRSFTVELLFR